MSTTRRRSTRSPQPTPSASGAGRRSWFAEEAEMSDISILSNEYERASALSKKLDSTLLDLKKERRGLPRVEESDATTVREKLRFLAQVLRAIALLLDP